VTIRELSPAERDLLSSLVNGDWEGSDTAREQLSHAKHLASWADGSLSFNIGVDLEAPLISRADGLLLDTERAIYVGDVYIGGVMLWLEEGRISGLEFYWTTELPPSGLPKPSQIRRLR
jgi:hypothetical protein